MGSLENIKTIFLDYDGTLHNSIFIYAPAFRKAYSYLVELGLAKEKYWSEEEISYWLGFNPAEMWETFMPELSADLRLVCSNMISEEMRSQIEQGNPVLYDGALEILKYLKNKGYHLVFLSNCKVYYMENHKKLFSLEQYFETFLCSEQYNFIPKHEILKSVKASFPEHMVMIGDRTQDMEAGKLNDIITIGCSYGYAREKELDGADIIIQSIKELKSYF